MSGTIPNENTEPMVEIDDGQGWAPVCRYRDLFPGRGIAVLVGPRGDQVAVFRERGGTVHALANRDPFSGAHVISRGLLGRPARGTGGDLADAQAGLRAAHRTLPGRGVRP